MRSIHSLPITSNKYLVKNSYSQQYFTKIFITFHNHHLVNSNLLLLGNFLLKAIATENSITELDDLISSPLLLITLLFKAGLIAGCIGFLIMSRHLGELSLSSCFEMIPFPPPPIKKLSLLKADKHCLVIGPQWITF